MVSTMFETIDNSWSDYALQLSRWNLAPIGVWPPLYSTSRQKKVASIVMIVVSYSLIMFTVIPSFLHVMLSDDNVRQKLRVVGPMAHWLVGGCNLTVLVMRNKQIQVCIDHVESDWQVITRLQDQQVMQNYAKSSRFISMVLAIWWHSSVLVSCAATAMTLQTIQIGNETRLVHPLPCAVYKKLFDVYTSPMTEITFALQFSSAIVVNATIVGSHCLAAVLVTHACGQLKVLMAWITEFVNDYRQDRKDVFSIEIGMIVEHHLQVLSLMSRIEDVMNRICFMGLFECTLDVCLLGYYILTEWADHDIANLSGYFGILIAIIFDVFIVCYIGEMMSEQSIKVGDVIYMTNWYCLPNGTIIDLILIIRRSSMLIQMTAGKLIRMSMYTFADVIKTSFAYLNFLRQTT